MAITFSFVEHNTNNRLPKTATAVRQCCLKLEHDAYSFLAHPVEETLRVIRRRQRTD